MKMINIVSLILAVSCLFFTSFNDCWGQAENLSIYKKPCIQDQRYSGSKLMICFVRDTGILTSNSYEYWLHEFIDLPDSLKLLIVEKLLDFEGDTTICCLQANGWVFNGLDVARGVPKTKQYSIEIDALFMINRLCWPKGIDWYSSYPVLFDTKENQEINFNPERIKCVFKEYRKWFTICKREGQIFKYFPFNDGRIVWFGGRKSLVPLDY